MSSAIEVLKYPKWRLEQINSVDAITEINNIKDNWNKYGWSANQHDALEKALLALESVDSLQAQLKSLQEKLPIEREISHKAICELEVENRELRKKLKEVKLK